MKIFCDFVFCCRKYLNRVYGIYVCYTINSILVINWNDGRNKRNCAYIKQG